jgi:hypothetical protein
MRYLYVSKNSARRQQCQEDASAYIAHATFWLFNKCHASVERGFELLTE